MKAKERLELYKTQLLSGELNLTLSNYLSGGILFRIDECIYEKDVESYKFLLEHIDSGGVLVVVSTFICEDYCDSYDPYYLYLIWVQFRKRDMDTEFLFELELIRRRGGFDYVPQTQTQKEKTLRQVIKEVSESSATMIQCKIRLYLSKKFVMNLRHEPCALFHEEFGESRRKMLGVQDHLWY